MAQSILQIILRVTKEGTGERQAAKEAKELKQTLGELGLGSIASATAVGVFTAAVGATVKFVKDAVDSTVAYAMEVKKLKDITGESAEETSRVIQVMDDFQVSTADLTMSQKKLAEQGLSLNIDTLAKLSDEYRRLRDGAERTRFLTDNFGKSGLKLASAMQAGGDALRKMADETLKSQVFTEQAIRDADEYRLAVDALNDAWLGFQWNIGRQVIPELTRVLKEFTDNHDKWFTKQNGNLQGSVAMTREYAQKLKQEMKNSEESIAQFMQTHRQMPDTIQAAADRAKDATSVYVDMEEALKAMSAANREFYKGVQTFQGIEDSYQEKLRANAEERKKIEQEKAEYIAMYGDWNVQKLQEFDAALEANGQKAQEIADEHEEATRKVILGYMEQKMMADGLLDDKEMEWLIAKGQAWGIYSQEAVEAYRKAKEEVDSYIAELNSIPSSVSTDVIQNFIAQGDRTYFERGYASGTDGWETVPAGYPNDSYPVFLTSGEKFAVIPAGQQVESYAGMPAGSWSGGQGGTQEVVVRLAGDAERLFQPVVERIVKRMR